MAEDSAKANTEAGGPEIQAEVVASVIKDAGAPLVMTRDSGGADTVPAPKAASLEITEAPEITAEEEGDASLLPKEASRQNVASPSGADGSQGSWGWGGWASSLTTAVSSFTEEAAKAAAEVSKTAAAAAKGVVDSIEAEVKAAKDEADKEAAARLAASAAAEREAGGSEEEEVKPLSEEDKKRLSALERLDNASKDSVLGQGLKVFDDSVETLTAGAFQAFGTAWKGSLNLVQKLEHSAESFAETIQQGGLVKAGTDLAPSILESGRAFTVKAGKALETVSKEALGLLAEETGFDLEKDQSVDLSDNEEEKEAYAEEVTFDHCFYIYGGPDHLEELEELANHHTLLCNRARAKLSGDERSAFDASLKQLQSILSLEHSGADDVEHAKGKGKELQGDDLGGAGAEVEKMREASIIKAAEMSSSFTSSLRGLAMAEVVERTADRLEAIKAEGIHRVSELCALCILHLLQLGKAALASGSKSEAEDAPAPTDSAAWPEDCTGKAELITARAQSMGKDIQAVVASFLTGLGDVAGAFKATLPGSPKVANDGEEEGVRQGLLKTMSIEERASTASSGLESDRDVAVSKLETGLQQLVYVLLSTTLKSN